MASTTSTTQRSIQDELAPFMGMTVVKNITIGQLNYVNQQDLYSTFAKPASNRFPANSRLDFFSGSLADTAVSQGYTAGTLSLSQTNSQFPRGKAPVNQAFVAVAAGFSVNLIETGDLSDTAHCVEHLVRDPNDLYTIGQSLSWDLNCGRGITRTIGPLAAYPGDDSPSAFQNDPATDPAPVGGGVQLGAPSCGLRYLDMPILFIPDINTQITAHNGSPFGLNMLGINGWYWQFRLVLRGYLMTMPVG